MKRINILILTYCWLIASFSAQAHNGFFAEINGGMSFFEKNKTSKEKPLSGEIGVGYSAIGPLRIIFSLREYHTSFKLNALNLEHDLTVHSSYIDFHYDLYNYESLKFFVTIGPGMGFAIVNSDTEASTFSLINTLKRGCGVDYKLNQYIYLQFKYDYTTIDLAFTDPRNINLNYSLPLTTAHNFMFGVRYHI